MNTPKQIDVPKIEAPPQSKRVDMREAVDQLIATKRTLDLATELVEKTRLPVENRATRVRVGLEEQGVFEKTIIAVSLDRKSTRLNSSH